MYDFLESIISNPLYATLLLFLLWFGLQFLLMKENDFFGINLSAKDWIKLEYIWVIVGFLGVLSIVLENGKKLKHKEFVTLEYLINRRMADLGRHFDNQRYCAEYKKGKWMSQEDFDKETEDINRICNWRREIIPIIEKARKNHSKIEKLPHIELVENSDDFLVKKVISLRSDINELLNKRDLLYEEIRPSSWQNFQYNLGVLLLIAAFALRLTIITYKVEEKNKKKKIKDK